MVGVQYVIQQIFLFVQVPVAIAKTLAWIFVSSTL